MLGAGRARRRGALPSGSRLGGGPRLRPGRPRGRKGEPRRPLPRRRLRGRPEGDGGGPQTGPRSRRHARGESPLQLLNPAAPPAPKGGRPRGRPNPPHPPPLAPREGGSPMMDGWPPSALPPLLSPIYRVISPFHIAVLSEAPPSPRQNGESDRGGGRRGRDEPGEQAGHRPGAGAGARGEERQDREG